MNAKLDFIILSLSVGFVMGSIGPVRAQCPGVYTDNDNDRIEASIDLNDNEAFGSPFGAFSDWNLGGLTFGQSLDTFFQVCITDLPGNGVRAEVIGPPLIYGNNISISVCTYGNLYLDASDNVDIICNTATIKVNFGAVGIVFTASDGSTVTAQLDAGNSVTYDQTDNSIAAASANNQAVVFTTEDGGQFAVVPGEDVSAAIVPFTDFDAGLEIKLASGINKDKFSAAGTIELDPAGGGLLPAIESAAVQIGALHLTIPPGSFKADHGNKKYRFEGVIEGVKLEINITLFPHGKVGYTVEGKDAELFGISNPVTFGLQIGNDGGIAAVTTDINHTDPNFVTDSPSAGISLFADMEKQVLYLNFTAEQAGQASVWVIDVHGKVRGQWEKDFRQGTRNQMVQVDYLEPGTYFVFVQSGKEHRVEKFVKFR